MGGDVTLAISPATLGSSAAAVATAIAGDGFTRDVEVTLENAAGDRMTWFNGSFAIAASETTAGDGTAAISGGGSTVSFVEGKATVTLEYTGTWAAADTATLTVTGKDILGYSTSNVTSVDTLVA